MYSDLLLLPKVGPEVGLDIGAASSSIEGPWDWIGDLSSRLWGLFPWITQNTVAFFIWAQRPNLISGPNSWGECLHHSGFRISTVMLNVNPRQRKDFDIIIDHKSGSTLTISTSTLLGLGGAVTGDVSIRGRERWLQEENQWHARPQWR